MVYEINGPFQMTDNKDERQKSQPNKNETATLNMVVSDAMAKNSRQLLYAHIYNYLIENKRYKTAKQFLMEADVPISEEYKENKVDDSRAPLSKMELDSRDLLSAKMLMDCSETFLLEWWECFSSTHNFVETGAADSMHEMHPGNEPVVPILPSKTGAYNFLASEPPNLSSSTSSALPPQKVANAQPHRYEKSPQAYNNMKFNSGQAEETSMDTTTSTHDLPFLSQVQQEQEQVLELNLKQKQQRHRQEHEQGNREQQRHQTWLQQHREHLQEQHQEQYQQQQLQQQMLNGSPHLQQPQHYYWQQKQQTTMPQQRSVQIDECNAQPCTSSNTATVSAAGTTAATPGLSSDLNVAGIQGTGYPENNNNATMILQQQLQQQLQKLQLMGMSSFNNIAPSPVLNMTDPNIQQQYMLMMMMNNSLQYPQQMPIQQNEYLNNNNSIFSNMSSSSISPTNHTPPNSSAQMEDADIMKARSTSLPLKPGTGSKAFTFLTMNAQQVQAQAQAQVQAQLHAQIQAQLHAQSQSQEYRKVAKTMESKSQDNIKKKIKKPRSIKTTPSKSANKGILKTHGRNDNNVELTSVPLSHQSSKSPREHEIDAPSNNFDATE